ncbi:MAG: hypothetical protein HY270_11275 [Deltaproteobacteria bacterium]|nr:hypothetical protein [Deltaproteobacteria bacterium]
MPGSWLRIAHRGASGSTPEHTRPAFERAVSLDVDMIELDVQLSRDEELVVMHDSELERTTNGRGHVREFTLTQLKQLDCGSWYESAFQGQPILTLEEVISIIGPKVRLNTEMKGSQTDWDSLAPRLLTVLERSSRLESTIVSCFQPEALIALRRLRAHVPLGILWQDPTLADAWRWARELGAIAVHPFWMFVDSETVAAARERHLQLIAWTVNDVDTIHSLVKLGVDGIISDFPERFALV